MNSLTSLRGECVAVLIGNLQLKDNVGVRSESRRQTDSRRGVGTHRRRSQLATFDQKGVDFFKKKL
jgi:hypothetical protein